MPELIRGMIGTMDRHPKELIEDVSKKVWTLKPWKYPFNVFCEKLSVDEIESIAFNLFEDELLPDKGQVSANYDSSTTTIMVKDTPEVPNPFLPHQLIMNTSTSERMLITNVNLVGGGVAELTVVRGWGQSDSDKVPGNAGDTLWIIGTAYPEKAKSAGSSISVKKTYETNYLQKFAKVVEISLEDEVHKRYTPNPRAEEHAKKLDELTSEIEKAAFFGTKAWTEITDVDGQRRKLPTTAGIYTTIMQASRKRVLVSNGPLTEATFFDEWMPQIMEYGDNDQKVIFASDAWIAFFTKIARDKVVIDDMKTKEYGMEIWKLISPFGPPLKIVRQPIFREGNQNLAMVIDMSCVSAKTLKGYNIKLYKDVNTPEERVMGGFRDIYMGFRGFFIANVMNHTIMRLS